MIRMVAGVAWWTLRQRRQTLADFALVSAWIGMSAALVGLLLQEVGKA